MYFKNICFLQIYFILLSVFWAWTFLAANFVMPLNQMEMGIRKTPIPQHIWWNLRTWLATGKTLILYCGPLWPSSRLVYKILWEFRGPLELLGFTGASGALQATRKIWEYDMWPEKLWFSIVGHFDCLPG